MINDTAELGKENFTFFLHKNYRGGACCWNDLYIDD